MNDENCQLETHNDTIILSPIYFRPSMCVCVVVGKTAFGFDETFGNVPITLPKIDILY